MLLNFGLGINRLSFHSVPLGRRRFPGSGDPGMNAGATGPSLPLGGGNGPVQEAGLPFDPKGH